MKTGIGCQQITMETHFPSLWNCDIRAFSNSKFGLTHFSVPTGCFLRTYNEIYNNMI